MVSSRRASRAGLGRQEKADDGVPDWLWRFEEDRWAEDGVVPAQYDGNDFDRWAWRMVRARSRWKEAQSEWLRAHGLVMWPMRGLSFREFRRIEREEPHRVLRRPGP